MQRQLKFIKIFAVLTAAILTGLIFYGRELRLEAKVRKTQQELAGEVFRFHVLANSDSEEDQKLKMQVKEAVISYMKESLPKAETAAETKNWAKTHEREIEKTAEEVIRKAGYHYKAEASVCVCDFPDKTYGDVFFPAGRYEALRIEIGKAGGRNWWCVLYPNLCFIDSIHAVVPEEGKEDLQEVLTDEEYEMVTAISRFKIKWFFFNENESNKEEI